MALSPISIFRSDENSLAQILQGGNQTVSGIMDRAIQIGRDISNKQLSQEKDLSQMRQQQQAFDQRRAETAQQDHEDTRQFARGAFESDRNYGLQVKQGDRNYDLQVKQEERANAKDLFNMRDDATRTGFARQELEIRKSGSELDKKAAENQAEQRRRVDEYFSTQYGGNSAEAAPAAAPTVAPVTTPQGPSPTSPGALARQIATDPASLFGPKPVAAPVAETPAAAVPTTQTKTAEPDIKELFGLESKLTFDLKNVPEGHPAASKIAQQLGEVKGQIATLPRGGAELTNSEKLSSERLEISRNTEKRVEQDREIENLSSRISKVVLDPEAFPKWGGTTPTDLAWDDPNQRPVLEANNTEDYDSAQAYADAWKGRNSKEKPPSHVARKRKEVWEAARRLRSLRGKSEAAPTAADPWKAVP